MLMALVKVLLRTEGAPTPRRDADNSEESDSASEGSSGPSEGPSGPPEVPKEGSDRSEFLEPLGLLCRSASSSLQLLLADLL